MDVVIIEVDPQDPSVRAMLESHLAFAQRVTPPGHVHALDVEGLLGNDVTLFGARGKDVPEGLDLPIVLGIGALRTLPDAHVEVKSMHVAASARGHGVGRAMIRHLLAEAKVRSARRVSLETGTNADFAAARALYASVGFEPCEPFADYAANEFSTCMTRLLG